ncbi:unnamed protein product, partial [Lymnaea stagnalis]
NNHAARQIGGFIFTEYRTRRVAKRKVQQLLFVQSLRQVKIYKMRRSAAPSQTGSGQGGLLTKRPKFTPPIATSVNSTKAVDQSKISQPIIPRNSLFKEVSPTTDSRSEFIHKSLSHAENLEPKVIFKCAAHSKTNYQPLTKASDSESDHLSCDGYSVRSSPSGCNSNGHNITQESSFLLNRSHGEIVKRDTSTVAMLTRKPLKEVGLDDCYESPGDLEAGSQVVTQQLVPQNLVEHETSHSHDSASSAKYFQVVWCKLSKKKHKKWEGDAVLSVSGRSATLFDMEGKIIGRGSGYKIAQLESLSEDEMLVVGGKEVQVMSALTEEKFKSGKCFTSTQADISSCDVTKTGQKLITGVSKPFINPLLKSTTSSTCNQLTKEMSAKVSVIPKYDPNIPGALVMPRPNVDHQWKHNRQGHPVTDVVVDPYLSSSLRSHQREGVVFLYECIMGMRNHQGHGAILADDMGLGKTLQCICLIWTLLKQGPYGGKPVAKKVLIVTPGSLVKNWFLEFKKWLGVERLSVYAVSGDKRAEDFSKMSGVYPALVISYEMFVRCHPMLVDIAFDLIICDEGHRLKNTATKTTALMMSLPCKRRVVLTGTPVQNDLQEFYSIVQFCNPGIFGTSAAFRRVYEEPIVASRQPKAAADLQELGAERAQELTRLTQMFVLRRTQEVNNDYLPPKVELVLFCRPSQLQLGLYRQLIQSQAIRRCLSGILSGSPHLTCIGALKQLCNHPSLLYHKACQAGEKSDSDDEASIYDGLFSYFPGDCDASAFGSEDSGKLSVLSGLLSAIWENSSTEKVVLVSNHTKTLDFLQVFCDRHGYSYVRLDGQTPTAQRQDIVTRFNKFSHHRVFLLSSKAGGVGLNLVGACRLILYDIDWNPANDMQAMARVWRDGQKGKVHIYRLLTVGTIEEKIYQRQISKQGLSGAVMDISNKNNVQFSLEDLKDLFSLNEQTDCETHSKLGCECEGDPTWVRDTQDHGGVDERVCQLGKGSSVSSKAHNLTMAELLHWNHWRGQFAGDLRVKQ